ELSLALLSVMVAVAGLFTAYRFYVKDPQLPAGLAERHRDIYALVSSKYRVDEMYDAALVRPLESLSERTLYRGVDRKIIDQTVNRLAAGCRWLGARVASAQTGSVR